MDQFDNTPSKIAQRTLEVFPLDVLRKEFNLKGDTDEVTKKIVATSTLDDLKEDMARLMGHCKQHVYLFTHKLKAGKLPKVFFGQNVEYKGVVEESAQITHHEYLLRLKYEYYEIIAETAKARAMGFWWPIRVIVEPGMLQVRVTIMERNTKVAKNILYSDRTIDDDGIILSVKAALGIEADTVPLDLNKGIKALWKAEEIDSSYAAHKTAKSLESSAMDSGYTIKKDAPDKFKEMMSEPLRKAVFSILKDQTLPELFASDPGEGKLVFRRYSDDVDGVDKLVKMILKLNG